MHPRRSLVALSLLLLVGPAMAQNNTTVGETDQGLFGGDDRVLHRFDNPLPAPLDGGGGAFLLEVGAYAVLALLALFLLGPLLKRIASRIPGDLDNNIIAIVRRPGFILLFVIGVKDSLRLLDLTGRLGNVVHSAWDAVLIIAGAYVFLRLYNEVLLSLGKKVAKSTESQLDDKLYPFFAKVGDVVIFIVAGFFVLESFNIDLTLFAAGGAVVSIALAFAAQDTIGNFFAGVFILLDRPFREGDRIEIKEENTWGDVVEIGLRTTRIRTRDNRMVIVPNALIGSNAVINHSFPSADYRLGVDVGLAYGTDLDHATEVLREAIAGVEGVNTDRRMEVLFREFGDSALEFHVRAWFPHYLDARRYEDKMNRAIDAACKQHGIEIPFPQRVVHLREGRSASGSE